MFTSYILHPDAMLGSIETHNTQVEADKYGLEATSYGDPVDCDDPNYYDKYDPPVALLFEAKDEDAWNTGKFSRPIAIFQRGQKFTCTIDEAILPPR